MITKLSHTTLFVKDQDKAYEFYVNKLGFKVHTDVTMPQGECKGDEKEKSSGKMFRWLTLNAPEQPDVEIILMSTESFEPEAKASIDKLLNQGLMGAGVFTTPDCRATYAELKAKGVEFKSEPKEQFYGIECIMTDGCGNWFSVTQSMPH